MDLKGLLPISISSAITVAKWLLEEMGVIHMAGWSESSRSFRLQRLAQSLSAFLYTSNKICSLIPYLKHCSDLVWCILGRMLTLCKRIVTRRPRLSIVVACRQAVHQHNFRRQLNSFITLFYYSLLYFITLLRCLHHEHASLYLLLMSSLAS